jgi:hypothetical protein
MIRLTGLVNLKAVGSKPIGSTVKEELTDKQKQLDVDGDGKLEKSDFEKLRAKNEADLPVDDHEGEMAQDSIAAMIHKLQELQKVISGNNELEGWVQEKITLASDYITSVYDRMHGEKVRTQDAPLKELSPKTSASYIEKSKKDRNNTASDYYSGVGDSDADFRGMEKRIDKRSKGIQNANRSIAKTKKPGETWTTSSGRTAKKNQDGTITYSEKK